MRLALCALLVCEAAAPGPAHGTVYPVAASVAAGEAPSADSVDALWFDVMRIVEAEEGSGWLLDEMALDALLPALMQSVCRATPAVRARTFERMLSEAAALGDPRVLFEQDGELSGRTKAALAAQRRVAALGRGNAAARACPFWLQADPEFRGLQSTRDRFVVNFDTGGTVQLRRSEGLWTIGAGGFGRALAGYGFTHVSLLSGIEFGGGALLEPHTHPTEFIINYSPAVPFIVRLHDKSWNLDLETAAVGLFQASNTALSYGVRGGVTLGISSLRLRGVLPWVGLGLASEYHFANAARPGAFYLRGGLRVGGVWDP